VVVEDDFDIESGFAESQPLHDAAGNLTYDGVYHYVYDAWNRPMKIHIDDGDGAFDSDDDTLVAEFACDGLGRRITKQVKNSADWDSTYHTYYDLAWRRIEVHDGSDNVLKQYVWGARYIDNIVQIGVNRDPENPTQQDCEWFYYPVQDANFNVLGLVSSTGALIERYEYTPYGERTAYKSAGSNDETTSAPLYGSQRVLLFLGMNPTGYAPYGLCDIGHQGLFLDPELGLYDNRHRALHPRLMRFLQRDPIGYADGMSLYEYVGSSPTGYADPGGGRTLPLNTGQGMSRLGYGRGAQDQAGPQEGATRSGGGQPGTDTMTSQQRTAALRETGQDFWGKLQGQGSSGRGQYVAWALEECAKSDRIKNLLDSRLKPYGRLQGPRIKQGEIKGGAFWRNAQTGGTPAAGRGPSRWDDRNTLNVPGNYGDKGTSLLPSTENTLRDSALSGRPNLMKQIEDCLGVPAGGAKGLGQMATALLWETAHWTGRGAPQRGGTYDVGSYQQPPNPYTIQDILDNMDCCCLRELLGVQK